MAFYSPLGLENLNLKRKRNELSSSRITASASAFINETYAINLDKSGAYSYIQLLRQTLPRKSVKAYGTMPKGSLGNTQ